MRVRIWLLGALVALSPAMGVAAGSSAIVVATCGGVTMAAGYLNYVTIDTNGLECAAPSSSTLSAPEETPPPAKRHRKEPKR